MYYLINSINSLWILDVFWKLCLILDAIIYTIAGWLFNTFYEIAGMSIINRFQVFEGIYNRITLLIGMFALFVLVKSMLANLIDPDKAAAESSKIVKNIVMSIVLLISIPLIFDILNGFQIAVVESDAIPKLVMNTEMVEDAQVEDGSFFTMNNVGNILMNNVFLLFFRYEDFSFENLGWKIKASVYGSNWFIDLSEVVFDTVGKAFDAVSSGAPILVLLPFTNSSKVYYEYPVISGIVGLVFCYYFLKIAVSIGIRMFKLFALQVIAPIPIILSINPSQNGVLNNYFKYLTKTYADLFIRLFCVMLVYPVIITLTEDILPDRSNLVINLILIIALLKFAKEFPKILSEILNLDIKLADKGPGGFLGGLFGTGVGLATGAMVSKNVGLKGKDFALHTLATGFKGGVSGHKGGQQGVIGFGKSMVGGTANSYVDATQIYSTGGYGNWLKAKMYEKTGQSTIFAQQREKLSDAVTNSQQHYDSLVEQKKSITGLKETAQSLYDEAYHGGIKNSYEYQDALQRKSDAVKSHDAVAFDRANTDLQRMDLQYDMAVAKFYNNAMPNSTMAQAATLASIKEQLNAEIRDVDPSLDISSYENIDAVANEFQTYVDAAQEERNRAVIDLQEFKKREDVQIANYKLENGNRYKSSRSSTSGMPRGSGSTRPTGPSGSTRPTGTSGPTGPSGPTRPTGPSGPTRPTGPSGSTRPTGPSGPTRPTGPSGSSETSGESGPTGPSGSSGPTGPTS